VEGVGGYVCDGYLAGLEGGEEVVLIDDAAAGTVDDVHALLDLLKRGSVEEVARVRRQGRVEGDEVGERPDLVQVHLGDAQLLEGRGGQRRVEADHLHVERLAPLGHLCSGRVCERREGRGGVVFVCVDVRSVRCARSR
jgi:hypothetical protein